MCRSSQLQEERPASDDHCPELVQERQCPVYPGKAGVFLPFSHHVIGRIAKGLDVDVFKNWLNWA